MKRWLVTLLTFVLVTTTSGVIVAEDEGKAEKREKINAIASEALESVLSQSTAAKELYEQAYGYAVFDNWKFAFGVSGGGGAGVAVARADDGRTYMKMGTGGVGLGLGGQKYQVVFLIQNEKTFNNFVNSGWQADTQATAAAGTAGASAATSFSNGLAVYQLTEKGLMANADITGTKYWKHKKLN
jgi:lipid-binding SYLF domain-containing protein